jgi:hypothetical protein
MRPALANRIGPIILSVIPLSSAHCITLIVLEEKISLLIIAMVSLTFLE